MLNELIPGRKPPGDQLKVSEDEALGWLSLIVKHSTAYSYRTHLKLACALGRESTAWDTVLVKASLRAKLTGNPVDIKTNKWVCQKELLGRMVSHCEVNNMTWLKVLMIVSFVYQFRVFSEYFLIRYCDVRFEGMDRPVGTQTLNITVDKRKNRKYRHTVTRQCTCTASPKKGEVDLGVALCVVHVLYKYLQSDPFYALSKQSGSVDLRLMCDVDQSVLNKVLKDVAAAVGDVNALVAASHGFRRGFACDLALSGAQLAEILERGDWRSLAFKA